MTTIKPYVRNEHPTFIGKDEPLSLNEIAVFGADAERCNIQTQLFIRQAELAKRQAAQQAQRQAEAAAAAAEQQGAPLLRLVRA
jgi:hypothetical protein